MASEKVENVDYQAVIRGPALMAIGISMSKAAGAVQLPEEAAAWGLMTTCLVLTLGIYEFVTSGLFNPPVIAISRWYDER